MSGPPRGAGSEVDRLRDERDAWKALAEGRAGLLACYRTGSQPSNALFIRLDKARKRLLELDQDPR